jgi:ankyrin repeat protein
MLSSSIAPALYNACWHGDAAAVSRLLPVGGTDLDLSGAPFQHPNPNEKGTPLMVAAQYGHTGIVRIILERAPNTAVDYANATFATALTAAAEFHHFGILPLLAAAGANVNYAVGLPGEPPQNNPLRLAVAPSPLDAPPREADPNGARQVATVKALLRLGAGTLPPPPPPAS